jgi:hypothetical protein
LPSDAELLLPYDPVNDPILKMKKPNIPDENSQPHEVTLYQIRMQDYKETIAKADELRAFILQTLSKDHHFVVSQAVSPNATARELLHHTQRVLRSSDEVLEHLLLTEYGKLRAEIRSADIVTWCYKVRTLAIKAQKTTMAHDTGSTVQTLFIDEVEGMYGTQIANIGPCSLRRLQLAAGVVWAHHLLVQLRVLTPDCLSYVLDWQPVTAYVIPRTIRSTRLLLSVVEEQLYTCMVPRRMDLYVGSNKTEMREDVPAGL